MVLILRETVNRENGSTCTFIKVRIDLLWARTLHATGVVALKVYNYFSIPDEKNVSLNQCR
jgi:hypothetical protein